MYLEIDHVSTDCNGDTIYCTTYLTYVWQCLHILLSPQTSSASLKSLQKRHSLLYTISSKSPSPGGAHCVTHSCSLTSHSTQPHTPINIILRLFISSPQHRQPAAIEHSSYLSLKCPTRTSPNSAQPAPSTLPRNNPLPVSPSTLVPTNFPSPFRSPPSSSPAASSLSSSTSPSSTKHPSNYKSSSLSSRQFSASSPSSPSSYEHGVSSPHANTFLSGKRVAGRWIILTGTSSWASPLLPS